MTALINSHANRSRYGKCEVNAASFAKKSSPPKNHCHRCKKLHAKFSVNGRKRFRKAAFPQCLHARGEAYFTNARTASILGTCSKTHFRKILSDCLLFERIIGNSNTRAWPQIALLWKLADLLELPQNYTEPKNSVPNVWFCGTSWISGSFTEDLGP